MALCEDPADCARSVNGCFGRAWMVGAACEGCFGDCRPWDSTSQTLATVLVVVCTVLTGLLALTWLQNRNVPAFGMWTISFALCAAAAGFVVGAGPASRAFSPSTSPMRSASSPSASAGRPPGISPGEKGSWAVALAPALALACRERPLDLRRGSAPAGPRRVARGRHRRLRNCLRALARRAARALDRAPRGRCCSCSTARRSPRASCSSLFVAGPQLETGSSMAGPFHPIAILEALVLAVALAFLLLSAAKDEIGLRHREAALIDPLTGVLNRRGFEAEAERMLSAPAATGRRPRSSCSTSITSRRSTTAGVIRSATSRLQAVAKAVAEELRGGDVIGRLGGEEFAIALAGNRTDQAAVLAERIRRAVAALGHPARRAADRADGQHRRRRASRRDLAREAHARMPTRRSTGRRPRAQRVELAPTLMMARVERAPSRARNPRGVRLPAVTFSPRERMAAKQPDERLPRLKNDD